MKKINVVCIEQIFANKYDSINERLVAAANKDCCKTKEDLIETLSSIGEQLLGEGYSIKTTKRLIYSFYALVVMTAENRVNDKMFDFEI